MFGLLVEFTLSNVNVLTTIAFFASTIYDSKLPLLPKSLSRSSLQCPLALLFMNQIGELFCTGITFLPYFTL